jgi:hypothetical protein
MKKQSSSKPGYGKILDAWVPPEDGGEPIGCVATSFTFSPSLFEQECLGRFLNLASNADEDGPAYLVEREEKLSQLECAAALVDQHYARGARSMRWDLIPVRPQFGILHAKVSLLSWSRHTRLIVGSANLTDDGYRRNHEIFGVLDYGEGSDAPLSVLHDILVLLREAAKMSSQASENSPAVVRCLKFLDRLSVRSGTSGASEPPRRWSEPRVVAVLTGPGRDDAFLTMKRLWPDTSLPHSAYVISPFFDPPEAPNKPARQIWELLKQRGAANVEYDVEVEEVTEEQKLLVRAPESLRDAQPDNRDQVETDFRRLDLEEGRPLHAKCIWLENDRFVLHMIGSSNFTSAGLGLGKVKNLEANLAYLVNSQATDAWKMLQNAWLPTESIPNDVERQWQIPKDNCDDAPNDTLPLPVAFADATFGRNANGTRGANASQGYLVLTFVGTPPPGWTLFAEDEVEPLFSETDWQSRDCPATLKLPWLRPRPPYAIRVQLGESAGNAWWPVNVVNSDALPPPDELKDLPLELLIEILTSAKPLHEVLRRRMKRKGNDDGQRPDAAAIDPHKRVDTSAFLLQRTRRVSWALAALRKRFEEQPIVSEQSLTWRLRGPVGVLALAQAITNDARESRSEAEQCFLLTELCAELARVRPSTTAGSLPANRVRAALREIVSEIRVGISSKALAADPAMAAYVDTVFQELVK